VPEIKRTPALSSSVSSIRTSVFADLAPRIEAFTRRGGRPIALHIGDTHLSPPEGARFTETGEDAALYRYGGIDGTEKLRSACVAFLVATGRGGAATAPGLDAATNVLLACGATHALYCAARAVLDPGDDALVAAPYWPLSVGVLLAAGARPVEVPLTDLLYADPGLDPAALFEARATPRTRALYLITPNNPDGKVLSRAQLERIAAFARARELWVIADEVYADYTFGVPHVSIASIDGMAERTLTAYSFSKSHALAGARVGFVVGPERAIRAARRVSTHTIFNVPVVAQRAACAALDAGPTWVEEARREYLAARDSASEGLTGSGVRFSLAEGGTYLFLDFRELLGDRPLLPLLERAIDHGVLLAPGDAFGEGYERWARLCFTSVPRDELREGIARLRAAIDDL
jgi:aspartate/methionine/tyrosine aminotransferase